MKLRSVFLSTAIALTGVSYSSLANAGGNPFIGQIMQNGYNFCPRGWAETNGQLIAISSNEALFSLVGTIYGGDGRTTFALPDLRSRVPVHAGHGSGLSSRSIGQRSGAETNVATVNQLPPHTHRAGIRTLSGQPNTPSPVGASFSVLPENGYRNVGTPTARYMNLNSVDVEAVGGSQSQPNLMPYQVTNYCIALVGIYPSRS